jgi:NADH-quinone oxidoreductase subunit M
MGMPGLSGFAAEFPIFIGTWRGIPEEITNNPAWNTGLTEGGAHYYVYISIIAALGIILTAAYVLRVTGQVFFGEFNSELYHEVEERPLRLQDRAAIVILGSWLIIMGVYPQILSNKIQSAVEPVVGVLTKSEASTNNLPAEVPAEAQQGE